MNHLLTEEVKRMQRLAGIETNDYQFKDFLWALYEVNLNNYSQDNILNEGIIDDVKANFAKLSTKFKPKIKNTFNAIKKYADPAKVFQDFNNTIKGVDPKDLPTLLALASTPKASLKEAVKSISKTSDLSGLKEGDVFTWDGATEENFDDPQVFNFKENKDFGLIQGYTYQVLLNPDGTVGFHQDKQVEDVKKRTGGYLARLNNFYEKYPWVKKLIGAVTTLSFLVSGHAPLLGDTVDTSKVYQTGGAEYPYDDTSGGGEGGINSVDLGGEEANLNNFTNQAEKLGISPTDVEDVSTAGTFKTGEYKLNKDQKAWAIEKGVKDVLKQIEDLSAKKGIGKTITVNGKIIGYNSENPGANDNIANDGSKNLNGLRAQYADDEINSEVEKDVIKIVQDKLGKDVKVIFKTTTTTKDSKSQVEHNPINYSADQSFTIKYSADSAGGTKAPLKLWNPLAIPDRPGGNDPRVAGSLGQNSDLPTPPSKELEKGKEDRETRGDERRPGKEETPGGGRKLTPSDYTNPKGDEIADKAIKSQSRDKEIVALLKIANPNLELNAETKPIIQQIRRTPNVLIDKIATILGVNLGDRQKTRQRSFQRSGMTETVLAEDAMDDKLVKLGVTVDAIKANKDAIIKLITAMYKLQGGENQSEKPSEKITTDATNVIKNMSPELKQKIKNDIRNVEDASDVGAAIFKYMDPDFQKSQANIRAGLNKVSSDIPKFYSSSTALSPKNINYSVVKEAEQKQQDPDVKRVLDTINRFPNLKKLLSYLNNPQEVRDFILYGLFPNMNPNLTKDESNMKRIMQLIKDKVLS